MRRRTLLSGLAGAAAAGAVLGAGGPAAARPRRKGRKMKITTLAEGLLFPEGPVALPDGDVLVVEIHRGTLTRVRPDGTTAVAAETGGGPNGAALGPDGRVYIANCGGLRRFEVGGFVFAGGIPDDYETGSVQAVDLATGAVETLYTEADGAPLRGPNDLVFDAHGGIYFTDYGKSDGVTGDKGRLFYAKADGSAITMIAAGLEGPNGIGLSPGGDRLYVSETYTARVWWWDVTAPGRIEGGRSLGGSGGGNFLYTAPDYTNFDSLGVDAHGNVCVASMVHAGISVVSPRGRLVDFVDIDVDGDPGITNICWGGDGMRTAYVTASSTGRLLKIEDWPRPGLKLNYAG
ncbi:SMP-30/gluconolactonase/LRE family protein [Actinomadura rifamycini]|uniref:SMP-30/gluconolactonase/LRE family protein n=1 Tax=Actinomadura rifamycini TaxID=31962 RepID=UPI001B7F9DC7|nr:SMP-30/gluconolactonase/LRE family protein [Actinomadura rifamycini]